MPTYLRTIRDRESVAFLVLETFNDSIISLSCTILVIHMYNNPCRMKEPVPQKCLLVESMFLLHEPSLQRPQ